MYSFNAALLRYSRVGSRSVTTASIEQPPKRVEKGILFSAPCLDSQFQRPENTTSKKRVEKGFLFSAPCLDSQSQIQENNTTTKKRVEKGFLFSAPCLDMDRKEGM